MPNFDVLRQFQPGQTPEAPKPKRKPQKATQRLSGRFVGFDQSLTNTGFVVVTYDYPRLKIEAMGTLHTSPEEDRTGWDDVLHRTCLLHDLIVSEVLDVHTPDFVVHESPPLGGGSKLYRTESTVLGSAAIHLACWGRYPVAMVAPRKVKKYLTNKASGAKKEVRAALERRFPDQLDNKDFRKNEHTFDALGVVVTYLSAK